MTIFLYILVILIWGTTWFSIKFQLGVVPPEISVSYRFYLASAILFGICLIRKIPIKVKPSKLLPIFALGTCMFGINYLLTYITTQYLTSGIVALLFSLLSVVNVINFRIFLKRKPGWFVWIGSCIGVLGVALVFETELNRMSWTEATFKGLGFGIVATYFASIGNMIAQKIQDKKATRIMITNAYGMAFGATINLLYGLVIRGDSLVFDPRPSYAISMVYLSIMGTVVAFGAYLSLIDRIGADRAAYTSIIIPIVALFVSSLYENFQWTLYSMIGICLVIVGQVALRLQTKHLKKLKLYRSRT